MTHAFSSLDELGEGPGFRKVRAALGVTAFGINAYTAANAGDEVVEEHTEVQQITWRS